MIHHDITCCAVNGRIFQPYWRVVVGKKWQLHTQNLDTYADFSVRLRNNIGFHTQNLEQKVHLSSKNRIDWDFGCKIQSWFKRKGVCKTCGLNTNIFFHDVGAGHNMWPINYWGLASISTSYASASLECRVEFGRPDIIFAANFGVPLHSKAICCYFGRIVGVAVNDLRLSNSHAKQSWFRNEVWAGAANLPLDFTSYSQNQCVAIPNHSPNCTKLAVVGVCTKQSHSPNFFTWTLKEHHLPHLDMMYSDS